jgi:phosphopantothenoylcysteine decarboxylase/phosphopantothenate--cysteine ligase
MANILLGITGGIAAYKACDLISRLRDEGHNVRVVMTENASQFITKVTVATLSGNPVLSEIWSEAESGAIDHIAVTQKWADVFLIAPASANSIHNFATGQASDYLSLSYLAASCPKVVVPAMNPVMWENKAVKRNVERIKKDGAVVVNPATGVMACKSVGVGKLPSVKKIIKVVNECLKKGS